MQGYEHLLLITDRIPRTEVFDIQNGSHAFLMVAHQGIKGISSSKLYEYLNFNKPIILCPDDHDIIRETLIDTGLGVICDSSEEVTNKLSQMAEDIFNLWVNTTKLQPKANRAVLPPKPSKGTGRNTR